ncbi:MAG: GGDEF domain-containing protein, partial [Actinobacteria bacterium]
TMSDVRLGVALLAVLVGLCIVVLLEGSVTNRLVRLRDSVREFPEDGEALDPQATKGSDEIADLAIALNDTLGRIKASEEEHKHDARHDHLTGLANRRRLEEDAERILAKCSDSDRGACCTLVLLDLDDFKLINDDLGHQVGDEVLVWFGEHMREFLRADSTLCRLGGDEFAVLMPRTNREEAVIAIERLREATSRDDDNPCFGMAKVRFSVGYAVAPDHGETLEMLMQCADTDLYANKRGKSGEG